MGHSDIGNHCKIRASNFCQTGHLTLFAHTHLNDRYRMLRLQPKQGNRQTDLAVEITLCFHHVFFGRKRQCQHLFGCSFAHTAGHTDNRNGKLIPIGFCDFLQSSLRILHIDPTVSRVIHLLMLLSQGCHSPLCKCRTDIAVTVTPLSDEWYK